MSTDYEILALADECGIGKLGCFPNQLAAFYHAARKPLEEQLENERAKGIHSCHENCSMNGCVNRRLREQLSEKDSQITKAGEIMKERCALLAEKHWNMKWHHGPADREIRALPAVTLEDLK